jgi:hypothetical protein
LLELAPIISQIKLITEFIIIACAIPITAVAKNKSSVSKLELYPPSRISDARIDRMNLNIGQITPMLKPT